MTTDEKNKDTPIFAVQLLADDADWGFLSSPYSQTHLLVFDNSNAALAAGAAVLGSVPRVKQFRIVEWTRRIFHDPIGRADVNIGKQPEAKLPDDLPENVVKFQKPETL